MLIGSKIEVTGDLFFAAATAITATGPYHG